MKTKAVNSKTEALGNRIRSIKSRAENVSSLKESGTFKSLESDLEAAIGLQPSAPKKTAEIRKKKAITQISNL